MAQAQSRKAISVINPAPAFAVVGAADEMLSADVPLDALKASIKELIGECREAFEDAAQASGSRQNFACRFIAGDLGGRIGRFDRHRGRGGGGWRHHGSIEFSDSQSGTSVH